MGFIFILIIIILSGGTAFFFINKFTKTISSLKLDLLMTKKQLSSVINNRKPPDNKDFIINFLDCEYSYGNLNSSTNIYLYPDHNSPSLTKISDALIVSIIDKVIVHDSTWYYVKLPIDSDINIKGWVIENSLLNLFNDNTVPNEN